MKEAVNSIAGKSNGAGTWMWVIHASPTVGVGVRVEVRVEVSVRVRDVYERVIIFVNL